MKPTENKKISLKEILVNIVILGGFVIVGKVLFELYF